MLRVALAALSVLVIVGISLPLASAEGQGCAAPPEAMGRFLATEPPEPVPGEPFAEGTETVRTIADWRGRGVVMNFWATWCAPCVREMPALDRLQAAVADDGIAVLTVSADRAGAKAVEEFYTVNGITHLPVLIDKRMKLIRRLGVGGLPTTVLIDAGGRELARVTGVAEWDSPEVVAFVRRCLGG